MLFNNNTKSTEKGEQNFGVETYLLVYIFNMNNVSREKNVKFKIKRIQTAIERKFLIKFIFDLEINLLLMNYD